MRHEERLAGINQRLADIVRKAETHLDFEILVVEGLRDKGTPESSSC